MLAVNLGCRYRGIFCHQGKSASRGNSKMCRIPLASTISASSTIVLRTGSGAKIAHHCHMPVGNT